MKTTAKQMVFAKHSGHGLKKSWFRKCEIMLGKWLSE